MILIPLSILSGLIVAVLGELLVRLLIELKIIWWG